MRWIEKKLDPKNGDKRSRFVFAWKKTSVGKYTVWLEFYEVHEAFFISVSGSTRWWSEVSRNTADYVY